MNRLIIGACWFVLGVLGSEVLAQTVQLDRLKDRAVRDVDTRAKFLRRYGGHVTVEVMSVHNDESVVDRLGTALAAVPGVRLGFLFGSRALGQPRKDSDFDVAVLVDEPLASEEPGKTIRPLAARLGREVSSEQLRSGCSSEDWK